MFTSLYRPSSEYTRVAKGYEAVNRLNVLTKKLNTLTDNGAVPVASVEDALSEDEQALLPVLKRWNQKDRELRNRSAAITRSNRSDEAKAEARKALREVRQRAMIQTLAEYRTALGKTVGER